MKRLYTTCYYADSETGIENYLRFWLSRDLGKLQDDGGEVASIQVFPERRLVFVVYRANEALRD